MKAVYAVSFDGKRAVLDSHTFMRILQNRSKDFLAAVRDAPKVEGIDPYAFNGYLDFSDTVFGVPKANGQYIHFIPKNNGSNGNDSTGNGHA